MFIEWRHYKERKEQQKRIESMKEQTENYPRALDDNSKYESW